MPQAWNFTIEHRQAGVWSIPTEEREHWHSPWMHDGTKARDAFFGDVPLFPFRSGYPPGPPADGWGYGLQSAADNGQRIAWIAYEDLMIDLWDDPTGILLTALVPKSTAHLFGRGDAIFPEEARSALPAGSQTTGGNVLLSGGRFYPWQDVQRAAEPLNHIDGTARYKHRDTPDDHPVPVTWASSITWWLMNVAEGFKAYRRFGKDHNLRVIAIHE
jgi:hypothetical protein